MTTRIQQFTNTLNDATVARPNRPIALRLKTPGNVNAVNLEGATIQPGEPSKKTTTTDLTGAYTISGDHPLDLTPSGCSYLLDEDGRETELAGFAYSASPIAVSTLYPVPTAYGNQLLMRIIMTYNDGTPIYGSQGYVDISITDNATTADGRSLTAGAVKRYFTDNTGTILILQDVISTLTPNTVLMKLTWPNGSFDYYSVPLHPLGWIGAWDSATHYHKNLDTQASPSDVVSNGGLLYQCVVSDSLNHAPPHADFITFPGERVVWHYTGGSGVGVRALTAANLLPSSLIVAEPDDHDTSITTLEQQLEVLHYRTRKKSRRVTAATTATKDDDVIEVDGTTAAYNVTLMPVAQRNRMIMLKLVVSAAHAVGVVPDTGTEDLDGSSSLSLSTLNQVLRLVPNYNNTKWLVV